MRGPVAARSLALAAVAAGLALVLWLLLAGGPSDAPSELATGRTPARAPAPAVLPGPALAPPGAPTDGGDTELVRGEAEPARTAVVDDGVRRWRDLLRPVSVRDGRALRHFTVAHFLGDGSRRDFGADDPLDPRAFHVWSVVAVEAPGHCPRIVRGPDLESATDDERRLELWPASTVRVEHVERFERPELRWILVRADAAHGLGAAPAGSGHLPDRFAAELRELLEPGRDDARRAALLRSVRATPWFEPVTALGPAPEGPSAPFAAPFGQVRLEPVPELPVEVGPVAVSQFATVTAVADRVLFLSEAPQPPGEWRLATVHGAAMGTPDPHGRAVVYAMSPATGGLRGRVPLDAEEVQVGLSVTHRTPRGSSTSSSGLAVEHGTGAFERTGLLPSEHVLSARWRGADGAWAFVRRPVEVVAGEVVDLGLLAPDQAARCEVHLDVQVLAGGAHEPAAGRLDGAVVALDVVRGGPLELGVSETIALRATVGAGPVRLVGVPPGSYRVVPRDLARPEGARERFELVGRTGQPLEPHHDPDAPTVEFEVRPGAPASATLPVLVRAVGGVELRVPLSGSLFAPGVDFDLVVVRDGGDRSRLLEHRWDVDGYARARAELELGDHTAIAFAELPPDHPHHPDEVWVARGELVVEGSRDALVVLTLEPGATALVTHEALASFASQLASDGLVLRSTEHGRHADRWAEPATGLGPYEVRGLVPGAEYRTEPGGLVVRAGPPGSTVTVDP